jgi:hypothetical protein
VGALTRVLNDSWRELVNNRDQRVLNRTLTRDLLATRIIDMVLLGENDPAKLQMAATAQAA